MRILAKEDANVTFGLQSGGVSPRGVRVTVTQLTAPTLASDNPIWDPERYSPETVVVGANHSSKDAHFLHANSFSVFLFSLWLHIHVVLLCCIVVLSSVLRSSACFVLLWFHPSARSLSHPRSLLTSFRLVLAWPRLALIYHVLFCSCRFRLLLRVAFSFHFLGVVFCKSLVLSAALLYESLGRKSGWRFTDRFT